MYGLPNKVLTRSESVKRLGTTPLNMSLSIRKDESFGSMVEHKAALEKLNQQNEVKEETTDKKIQSTNE